MPKALVSIKDVSLDDGVVRVVYLVVILGPPNMKLGSDHILNPLLSLEKNLNALKDKIVKDLAGERVAVSTGDVIIFGAPVVADAASMKDETNGMTSDSAAVVKFAVVDEPSMIMAAASLPAEKGMWGKFVENVKSMWSA